MAFDPTEHPHRRINPLTGEAVTVSPHRAQRPWQGAQETPAQTRREPYDPTCYLCPGNTRVNGDVNPDYSGTFVFENDFPAVKVDAPDPPEDHPLLASRGVRGTTQVICYAPRHDLTLAEFDAPAMRTVVDLWVERATTLGQDWRWVQIFENKGEAMGASNPHPHGQVWMLDDLPTLPAKELGRQRTYLEAHGEPLLVAYQALERSRGERVVAASAHWLAVVPWWATWPFELLIVPVRHVPGLPDLNEAEQDDLAALLRRVLPGLDALFDTSFPYSMGWHGVPSGPTATQEERDAWQLHLHLFPPLLRSATVRKFMVGFEMLGEPQRDLTAEQAAARLRDAVNLGGKA